MEFSFVRLGGAG